MYLGGATPLCPAFQPPTFRGVAPPTWRDQQRRGRETPHVGVGRDTMGSLPPKYVSLPRRICCSSP